MRRTLSVLFAFGLLIAGLRPYCRSADDASAVPAAACSEPSAGRCKSSGGGGGECGVALVPSRKRRVYEPQSRPAAEHRTRRRHQPIVARRHQPRTVKLKTLQMMLMYAVVVFMEHMELAVDLAAYKIQLLYTSLVAPLLPK